MDFLLKNIEYFPFILIPFIMFWYIKKKAFHKANNDLTPYIVKLNKQKETTNIKSKSTIFSR